MHFRASSVFSLAIAATLAAGCTSSNTVRTSANTLIVHTSAEAMCGGSGAAKIAQKQAAVETIKAGFDRYIIVGAQNSNNVQVVQGPGTYSTTGTISGGHYFGTTTYQPGMPIVYGGYDQAFAIRMYKEQEPEAKHAVSAREILGPDWAEAVKKTGTLNVCF
ncbi:hypothetical protein E2A64_01125 [Pseudohoeflea suaedae]|uniref:Lipoprotein n=1 Tax=Pseudohoeflea suaedae TaxID=877384 RepID=A0A4R5PLG5_9HYPH|nr:hypothetical protein [Pseudohoeflea suaedae]TDH37772.1 hypothetical protein E2A64_01125 [Pseudohoeflea suaedae]